MFLHLLEGPLISSVHHEFPTVEGEHLPQFHILLELVGILLALGVPVLRPSHDLAAQHSLVLLRHLIHLNGVVTAEEGQDEVPMYVILIGRNQLALKSEDYHIFVEHLDEVLLGGLGLEVLAGGHRVFVCTESAALGSGVLELDCHLLLQNDGIHSVVVVLLPPKVGEGITIDQEEVLGVDQDGLSETQVSGLLLLFSLEGGAWIMGADYLPRQFLSLEQEGVGIDA